MIITHQTIASAWESGRWIADELGRVEAGEDPRTEFGVQDMRLMLGQLNQAITEYRKGLNQPASA